MFNYGKLKSQTQHQRDTDVASLFYVNNEVIIQEDKTNCRVDWKGRGVIKEMYSKQQNEGKYW